MPWKILVRDNPRSVAREEDRHNVESSAYQLALDLQLRLITDTNTRLTIKKSLPKNASAKEKLTLIHRALGAAYGFAQAYVEHTNTTASGRPMRQSALAARATLTRAAEPSSSESDDSSDDDAPLKKTHSSDMETPPEESSPEEETTSLSEEEDQPPPAKRRRSNQNAEIDIIHKMRAGTRARRRLLGSPLQRRSVSWEDDDETVASSHAGRWRIDSHNIIPQREPQLIRLTNKVIRTQGPARFFFRAG